MEWPDNLRLAKLPARVELALYLIESEFRNKQLVDRLDALGTDEDASIFSSDLSALILNLAGFSVRTDELYDWYHSLLDQYSLQVVLGDTDRPLCDLAFNFFVDLEIERRTREKFDSRSQN
jgi:hypothetical protein